MPVVDKIRCIAREIYGADDVEFTEEALSAIDRYNRQVRKIIEHNRFIKLINYIWHLSKLCYIIVRFLNTRLYQLSDESDGCNHHLCRPPSGRPLKCL